MFWTQSANRSLVMACVIGMVANGAVFAYGGPAGGYGSGSSGYGFGYPSDNRPLFANSSYSSRVPDVAPARLSNAASQLVDAGEIVLFNPPETLRDAQYSLNGVPYVMKPGTIQRLKNDRVWKVEVNSGTGQVERYTLGPGGYKFRPTGLRMSMGLFATQERPGMSTVASAAAPVPGGLLASSTDASVSIAAPQRLISDYAEKRLAQIKLARSFSEHSAPTISASQWINAIPLEQFRDKVVLLDFWGSWCGPCVRNLPKVQALYEKYKNRGLVVIGVHSAQGAESVTGFLASHPYSFPVAIDTGATAERYGVEGFPTYFLIDKSGKQTLKFAHEPPNEQQIENLLMR